MASHLNRQSALRQRFKQFLIIIVWLIAIILLLELGLRLFVRGLPPSLQEAAYITMNGVPFPESWDRAWTRQPDHYFILKPGLVDAVQFGSPSVRFHVSTIELWEGGGIGFRTRPVDYFVDVIALGDSFTFCFTERADCWVTRFEADTELGVVNLGQPGTGSHSHWLILRDFGKPLRPRLVLWQFFGNDFNDDYGLFKARGELPLLEDVASPDSDAEASETRLWLRKRSVLYAVLESVLPGWRRFRDPNMAKFDERYAATLPTGEQLRFGQRYEPSAMDMSRAVNQAGYEIASAALSKAQALVSSWGGQLIILIIPTREEVYESLTATALGRDLAAIRSARLAMLKLCAELNLVCYNALADMQQQAEKSQLLYYADDLHLNPLGNRVFAELLRDHLRAGGMLDA
ncbi:MAG: SGNH/GDSL hydrolase family protein [Chloroflexota bacterium]|nr:SGNH/GDSL hydrolase family protein [Chloroflexota bacterium]MCY3581121.1 SGNH/GDSL hydrolase family protein [Chloroflexota bacterium]MDE2650660.1 SGNH/GDSL hydrolase family protein [Chloroflexota bacterium]MXX52211.1 SGNH/GDSL hydrolase family protein [Chloroflexota bacterium]MYA91903.1 SGNH/GDSL hydrolase family protein [Chloroflexota bacterium]